jgi:hypothetical protein
MYVNPVQTTAGLHLRSVVSDIIEKSLVISCP